MSTVDTARLVLPAVAEPGAAHLPIGISCPEDRVRYLLDDERIRPQYGFRADDVVPHAVTRSSANFLCLPAGRAAHSFRHPGKRASR